MRTLERAYAIVTETPGEAVSDALGLGAIALLIFAGFLTPAFV